MWAHGSGAREKGRSGLIHTKGDGDAATVVISLSSPSNSSVSSFLSRYCYLLPTMAAGRHFRNEKRMPSFYVMATIVVFVALCLIGMWVLSTPSEEEIVAKEVSVSVIEREKSQEKTESEPQQFEESAGNVEQETEEKETPRTQSDSQGEQEQVMTELEEKKDKEQATLEAEEKEDKEQVKEDTETEKSTSVTQEERDDNVIEKPAEKSSQEEELSQKEKEPDNGERDDGNASEKPAEKSSQAEDISQKDKGAYLGESSGAQSEIQIESKEVSNHWETQASESKEEKEKITGEEQSPEEEAGSDSKSGNEGKEQKSSEDGSWVLCEVEGAIDYIPCLDNKEAIHKLTSTKHYEHRERHCPNSPPTCLVPLPEGYRSLVPWPKSRDEVWFSNVPHSELAKFKQDQNWVKKQGDKLVFPGGGTQFKHGVVRYIEFIELTLPDIAWGNHTRVILDVGCGVASLGGYLFDKEVLTFSFAPKDEHEAQIQFALERGIPAISAVMGTQRLVFPSNVFDAVHCARCRVPWHIEGGKLLLELNRVLRPGGYFIWSATPVYWKDDEDVGIWKEMVALTSAICWELVAKTKDPQTGVGLAIFHKPTTNFCYDNRKQSSPPLCEDDKPDAAWYIPMTACIHKLPSEEDARGKEWPQEWPLRLTTAPSWLSNEKGLYGKPAAADFRTDTEHWQRVVDKSYIHGLGIDWSLIRNVMDMKAVYGGFAAALASQPVWVMNVVPFDAADTLPIIFDRGLFGIYHDWCESFSLYPRTFDLLHSDHLFNKLKKRCSIKSTIVEIDRLLRPDGWVIFREKLDNVKEIEALIKSLNWTVRMAYMKGEEGLLAVQKSRWRPETTL